MRFLLILLTIVFFAASPFSYAEVGRDFDITLTKNIHKGKTTQDDVRKMFGEPENVTVSSYSDGEMWYYQHILMSEKKVLMKYMHVYFDKNGTVIKYDYSDSR